MRLNILIPAFLAIFTLLVTTGCEEKVDNSLKGKQEQLRKKRNDLATVTQEVAKLESEIATLDPSAGKRKKSVIVEVNQVTLQPYKHFIKVQGSVASDQNVWVSSSASGMITSMPIKEGQQVRKGQLLAKIDAAVMNRNLDEVKTQLDLANIMYEKQKRLWEQEIGTEIQYLTAKSQKESLERRMATVQEQLAYYRITSPITGVIDEIRPKLGEILSPGMPAIRIVNTADLSLKANLSERYIPNVKRGDIVKVNFPTLDKTIDAKVSVVGQTVEPTSRTFEVEVKLPRNPMLKTNMMGEVSINDQNIKEAITVPIKVLQQAEKGNYLFVAVKESDGTWVAKRKDIVIGSSEGEVIQVTAGLNKDDYLITTGFKGLSDGQSIELNQEVAANK